MNLIGFLGTKRDFRGTTEKRWNDFRPSVAACMHDELDISKFYLLHDSISKDSYLLDLTIKDINAVNAKVKVIPVQINANDNFDPLDVLKSLRDFARELPSDEEYLINLSTGTHAAHIVFFDLVRCNILNAKMIQTYGLGACDRLKADLKMVQRGLYKIIDLNLAKYDEYRSILIDDSRISTEFLKGGVLTYNEAYNSLISTIERVAVRNNLPILIGGATGAGKTALAKRLYDLKKQKGIVKGNFIYLNCATLRVDTAHSVLFGHKKGAFTGASESREGLIKAADCGVLFLDEIGAMALDVQSMLLHAIETKLFYPMGSDKECSSNFTLICGTNENLTENSNRGDFRNDLLARIDTWFFELPSLADRREDIAPNVDFELSKYEETYGERVRFNIEAQKKYLTFSSSAKWKRNFRDLSSSILRMCTLAKSGTITEADVADEIVRLNRSWCISNVSCDNDIESVPEKLELSRSRGDFFELVVNKYELSEKNAIELGSIRSVLSICTKCTSAKEASFVVFGEERKNPTSALNNWLERNIGAKFQELKALLDN
ncbi:RNA repair transcriptional activator RtcR family protein [Photobacterium kishitanii]|uniref:Transcriptional regulator n=1 Tax=Photobacterium kishitanii TaxID=318456 RepID=A0A2T3KL72_9GAMM|nr:RNA repair transcriptional activator RtcR family protein [Photobacterium kishitanii]PSV00403.1 transcriptional regulator [Photobacterium kishitanii]